MDWTKGFSSRYYISIVDKDTWRDIKRVEITGGSIKRSIDELRQSADINVVNYNEVGEPLIRVWLDARQEDAFSHIALFTGLATTPGRDIDGRLISRTLQCYSILKPAADILLPRGWYAPAEVNAVNQILRLLKPTKAPVEILENYSELNLKQAIIAEQNETNLSMVDVLLTAINWRMVIDGYGTIHLGPYPKKYSTVLDSMEFDIVEPHLSDDFDWYECPNVFRAIADETYAEARDEDPNSPFSIQNRGREIWAEERSCVLNEKETLSGYARRRLKELQQVNRIVSYDRRFIPELNVSDVVRLNYPAQELVGSFVITNQTINLGYNAKTSEEVMQV